MKRVSSGLKASLGSSGPTRKHSVYEGHTSRRPSMVYDVGDTSRRPSMVYDMGEPSPTYLPNTGPSTPGATYYKSASPSTPGNHSEVPRRKSYVYFTGGDRTYTGANIEYNEISGPGSERGTTTTVIVGDGPEIPVVKLPHEVDYNKLREAKNLRRTELVPTGADVDTEAEVTRVVDIMKNQRCDNAYHPVNALNRRYKTSKCLTSYRQEDMISDASKNSRNDPRRLQDFFECETSVQALLYLRKEPLRYVRDLPSYAMLDLMGCLVKYDKDLGRADQSDTCEEIFDESKAERVFREEVTVQMCIDYRENASYLRKRNLSYMIAAKEMYEEYKEVIDRIHDAEEPDEGLKNQYGNVYPEKEKAFYNMETLQIMCWLRTLWFLRSMTVEHADNVDKFLKEHSEHLNKLGRISEIKDEAIFDKLREMFNNLQDNKADEEAAARLLNPNSDWSTDSDQDNHPERNWPVKFITAPNCQFPDFSFKDLLKEGLLGDWKRYTVNAALLKMSTHDIQLVFENLGYCDFLPFWKTRIVLQFFASGDGYWDEMQALNMNLNSVTPVFDRKSVFQGNDVHEEMEIDPQPGYGTNNFSDLSYYQMLGIPSNGKDAEIQRAFRKKAKAYHPDKMKGLHADAQWNDQGNVMKFLNEARDVLMDEQERLYYDHFGKRHK